MDGVLVTTRMSADIRRHANSVDDDVVDEDDVDIDVTGKENIFTKREAGWLICNNKIGSNCFTSRGWHYLSKAKR